jgi:hypothetical protein
MAVYETIAGVCDTSLSWPAKEVLKKSMDGFFRISLTHAREHRSIRYAAGAARRGLAGFLGNP